jgi:hypothetical protein
MSLEMLKKRVEEKKARKPTKPIRGILGWNYPILNMLREMKERRWKRE